MIIWKLTVWCLRVHAHGVPAHIRAGDKVPSQRRRIVRVKNVRYGEQHRSLLDLYFLPVGVSCITSDLSGRRRPVLNTTRKVLSLFLFMAVHGAQESAKTMP